MLFIMFSAKLSGTSGDIATTIFEYPFSLRKTLEDLTEIKEIPYNRNKVKLKKRVVSLIFY